MTVLLLQHRRNDGVREFNQTTEIDVDSRLKYLAIRVCNIDERHHSRVVYENVDVSVLIGPSFD